MKFYMFRAVPLSIIRSLFTVHSALVYVITVWRELSSRTIMELAVPSWSCSKAVFKLVWHIPMPTVQWINSWWWAKELSETCRVLCRSKFGRLVHLVGFIIKKFVMMHGHMNVKLALIILRWGSSCACGMYLKLLLQSWALTDYNLFYYTLGMFKCGYYIGQGCIRYTKLKAFL
jgi:hypothetical protein